MDAWLVPFFQMLQSWKDAHPYALSYVQLIAAKAIFFGLFALIAAFAARKTQVPAGTAWDIPWGMRSVTEVFLIFLGFQALSLVFKNPGGLEQDAVQTLALIWSAIEYVFLFVLIWFFTTFVHHRTFAAAGWGAGHWREDADKAVRGVLFIAVLAVLTNFLYWTELLSRSSKIIERASLSGLFAEGPVALLRMALVLVISPACEETFYRGYAYPALRKRLPIGLATGLLALFFASVHFQWNYFILLMLMSCAATLAYEKSRRLWAPVAIHACYNFFVLMGWFTY